MIKDAEEVDKISKPIQASLLPHAGCIHVCIPVPRTYEQALKINASNGNTRWQDAVIIEMLQINEYETFIEKGIGY